MTEELDPFDVRRARSTTGLLRDFNHAGVLSAADVHVAERVCELAGENEESVKLAAALAVRAPRLGHVQVDLDSIRGTAAVDSELPVELAALPWPEAQPWIERVAGSPVVSVGERPGGEDRPLRLVDSWLYLDRYWTEERRVAEALRALSLIERGDICLPELDDGLSRLFGDAADHRQRLAAASAALCQLSVIAGGPGTGKTTTVARLAALLIEQGVAGDGRPPLMALVAPTGKAAARLGEAVREQAQRLNVSEPVRDQLVELRSSTLHRLLGRRPDSNSRFRHNRDQRLPHDVVIVDETSMVSLSLMARLLEALRPQARLVLVGDPGQLASIEAGAVLGDIVGPAGQGMMMGVRARERLSQVTGLVVPAVDPPPRVSIGDGTVVLDRFHRFGGGIAALADATRTGDADAVISLLSIQSNEVQWVAVDVAAQEGVDALPSVRRSAVAAGREMVNAAREGDGTRALEALGAFRLLCAHRRGPFGVASWTARIQSWLAGEVEGLAMDDRWYAGRPLLVTENDYELGLYNGDMGVVVQTAPGRLSAVFERGGEFLEYSPARVSAVDTAYAMTVHKSQGSQFDLGAVVLPDLSSRILTRELLYTAITRARRRLILIGTEESIRTAVERPIARASGLRRRLWQPSDELTDPSPGQR